MSSILDFAAAGDKQAIRDLIAEHTYEDVAKIINDADSEGRTTLHHAVRQGWADMVPALAAAGANIEARDANDGTPLYRAVENKDIAAATAMLQAGAVRDVRRFEDGLTALQIAITDNNLAMVKLLVDWGADVTAKTPPKDDGMNAYHFAARQDPAILDLLMDHPDAGALHEIFTADRKKQSVLRIALERSDKPLVEKLLDYGVDVNERDDNGETPLFYLLGHRDSREKTLPIIRLLIERGADLDKLTNYWGENALFPAVQSSYTEAVKLLLDYGADAKAVTVQGETLLHAAANTYDAKTMRMLVKAGADINARDRNKQTPLHIAANKNKLDVVDALLNAGADPFLKDKNGKTPRDLAPAEFQARVNRVIAEKEKEIEIKKYGHAMYVKRQAAEKERL
ncbi:MAG TPA: ankyrin repeat domain-containing protein, partial [Patescibacteria group bacterium]|nr:ankyrin repeat domain-containing protein [Patescibacteria group bacterium]